MLLQVARLFSRSGVQMPTAIISPGWPGPEIRPARVTANILAASSRAHAQVGVFAVGFELGFLPATEIVERLSRGTVFRLRLAAQRPTGPQGYISGRCRAVFLLILPEGLGIPMVADPMVQQTLGATGPSVSC
jgi:hypothetical protein